MASIALNSAASGLSALNTRLDVVANNLANVNTAGFKSSRVNFQDLLYMERAQPGVENAAGDERPTGLYVGLGVEVAGTQADFTEGAVITTDRELDVYISGDGVGAEQALDEVLRMMEDVELGKIYTGTVVRIEPYGVFVNILPGVDGMVHISQLADYRVEKVEDIAKLGDELTAMVIDIDAGGKVRLSRQAVLEGWSVDDARSRDRALSGGGGGRRGGDRGGRSNGRGGDRGPRRDGPRR